MDQNEMSSMEPPGLESLDETSMEDQLPTQTEQPQQNQSFIDNEFKTINTGPPPPRRQNEGVLFPDAPDTQRKNLNYIKWNLKII